MQQLLEILIAIPLVGFFASLAISKKREILISWVAFGTAGLQFTLFVGFAIAWLAQGYHAINLKEITIFKTEGYEFLVDFYFDKITAVYLFVGSFLVFLVMIYSRYYLHRESGYKRFFNTVLFFFSAYTFIIFSGNFETLFIGWEMLSISSFLLIAFYRDRYLPVRNAVKVFSIYRITDVGLILVMWMSHHLWHENITFMKLNNYELVHSQLQTHTWVGVFISLMLLIAAAAKSAQLPFSHWLARAMEGPTPSSAIFYGSLAVHVGIFLLMRTYPFWEHQVSIRVLIGILGFCTSIVATTTARVQSSVKAQIAYASVSQIGLIFIELSLGFGTLALLHFMGNAFLRTYQLLVSPSVVSYLIREQFYHFTPRQHTIEDTFPRKIEYSLYMLSLKEWNLDSIMYRFLWNPLKIVGKKFDRLNPVHVVGFFTAAFLVALYGLYHQELIPLTIRGHIPEMLSLIGLIFVLKSFAERKNPVVAWGLIIMNHMWSALAILYNDHVTRDHTLMYLGGIIIFAVVGAVTILRLKKLEGSISMMRFHGYVFEHPRIAFVFLLACLAVTGFPISPTFVGEDLIFVHIHEDQIVLATFVALSFIIDGLAAIRIYARLFLGPHVKSVYEAAYRSS